MSVKVCVVVLLVALAMSDAFQVPFLKTLKSAIKRQMDLGGNAGNDTPTMSPEVMMLMMDGDRNGEVNSAEVTTFFIRMSQMDENTAASIGNAIMMFDFDRSGGLNLQEFTVAMSMMSSGIQP